MNQAKPCIDYCILTNTTRQPLGLLIEPWGEYHTIFPGEKYIITAKGPPGKLEQEIGNAKITIYGWEKSTIEAKKLENYNKR